MSVKSAKRVLEIFELLTSYPNGLTIKEISGLLSSPQSSTFNVVKTLEDNGYLTSDIGKKYTLGAKLIEIGNSAMESMDLSKIGTPHLTELGQYVQETVFMAVLSDEELFYISKIDNNRSIRTTAQPGLRKPLYCTGLGKAFLAFMPADLRDSILERTELVPITEKTLTDRSMLEAQLETFYAQGYSIDDEENEEGLYCLAAPVFGAGNKLMAAVSVAGPKERMTSRKQDIIVRLKETTKRISAGLGHNDSR
ncbi:IclR family transcriptional regulator [Terribacillus saccharophilus]|uniref:IclR family transcriptional regulator n=1 Tax=Terribacillus saccharophilus TaxID=361277 RepID=A0A268HH18_9BACI|nr:IclR family transcriptional regulator [Terribacillus saccharophilus]PAE09177.1 IclR family transcriptional regulator [Terribacillus saccharophilus]